MLASSEYEELLKALESEDPNNVFAPFASELDYKLAEWAKTRGPGSTSLDELLAIPGVVDLLSLSFKNSKQLNAIIDKKLPGRPAFQREQIIVQGHAYDVYFRDIIACIRKLFGNPEFAPILVFAPERHYSDADQTLRLYHDMKTGRWWWMTQEALEKKNPGATIVPIIISSDKTQLTLFGNKTAYPIYITIGNLPKEVRRKPSLQSQVLLGYLPTTRLEHIKSKASRRRCLANLFHACMRRILAPLREAGINGINMASGDGVIRRVHPLFAVFVGDYPEQCLVSCTPYGRCPNCDIPPDELGEHDAKYPLRDLEAVLEAFSTPTDDPTAYKRACNGVGLHPVQEPFWQGLPYTHIFRSITPDNLHQMCQGVLKHLVGWLKSDAVFGPEEIDARCRRMSPNHNLRWFEKGISSLSKVSGQEHRNIARILLGLVVDLPLPGGLDPARLVRAVRALLDFMYLARYPVHSTDSLKLLKDALTRFHKNKDIFLDLGARTNFNFPKLHALEHYFTSIMLFGTTDNYDTEYSERLHIDFAKDAYRASNRRDEYPQMTTWLIRKEKVQSFAKFIKWRLSGARPLQTPDLRFGPPSLQLRMAQRPLRSRPIDVLATEHGAPGFRYALSHFLIARRNPELSRQAVNRYAHLFVLPARVSIYQKAKFEGFDRLIGETSIVDTIHVRPRARTAVPARFDTALVRVGTVRQPGASGDKALQGLRVAQVRAIFTLPLKSARANSLVDVTTGKPLHLAFVHWFSPFTAPRANHRMYRLTRSFDAINTSEGQGETPSCSVILLTQVVRSVHLFPAFGPVAPRDWSNTDSLEHAKAFYVNPFCDDTSYPIII
ncbi:hypothetical protein BOTBODRAFT_642713 [Botryobasidium botryosum FD-172 SS1]|uniref:Uncharacterized protein n=1 Tax=Botryobasidium botryosum (strain FD-172 SS1) TaxID=930990 RepID=A0A067M149_BOTB1|nr:hypothetical protein BOTBODRAFT_642713 [Botryobasidium botryosum FD-172 SS1]